MHWLKIILILHFPHKYDNPKTKSETKQIRNDKMLKNHFQEI